MDSVVIAVVQAIMIVGLQLVVVVDYLYTDMSQIKSQIG